jgi:hypothetical protein
LIFICDGSPIKFSGSFSLLTSCGDTDLSEDFTNYIVDKYSGSSSHLLLINSKMGAGVSTDTLKRYINNKCIQLNEHDDRDYT